jgi:zinc transporter ZupT
MLPSRGAYLLAFAATVIAGVLGGIIGYGIVDVTSDSGVAIFLGALVGALLGAIGVGVVAVLVLRAMAEWQRRPRDVTTPPVRRRS